MIQQATLLILCLLILTKNVFSMNLDNQRTHADTTVGFPALDVISYCYALKTAQEELANNPEALHQACAFGNLEKARLLMAVGADVHARCKNNNWTPLEYAIIHGEQDIAELIIHYDKAVLITRNDANKTVLHKAAWAGHTKIVKLLIHYGASINAQDNFDETPLHGAACLGHGQTVEVLLQHGATLNMLNINKKTALHYTAYQGLKNIAEILMSKSFFPPITAWLPRNNATLQERCLHSLLKHSDDFDKNAFNTVVLFRVAHDLALHSGRNTVLQILTHHAPLQVQQEILKCWRDHPSQENDNKIKIFLEAHYERHRRYLQRILAMQNNEYRTARAIARREKHHDMITLFDNVVGAQRLSDLTTKLQQIIKRTIEDKLTIS